jgi:hypothetical protein
MDECAFESNYYYTLKAKVVLNLLQRKKETILSREFTFLERRKALIFFKLILNNFERNEKPRNSFRKICLLTILL